MDYKSLTVDELVVEVNKLIVTGMSLTAIEKQWQLRNKYISDKIKGKYKLDKGLKQYVHKGEIEVVTRSHTVTTIDTAVEEEKEEPKTVENEVVITGVTDVVTTQEVQLHQVFEGDELEIIYKLIDEYRVKQKLQQQDIEADDKNELANRNIRVYTKQYNKFADWCKTNNVTQAEALYKAINLLMNV